MTPLWQSELNIKFNKTPALINKCFTSFKFSLDKYFTAALSFCDIQLNIINHLKTDLSESAEGVDMIMRGALSAYSSRRIFCHRNMLFSSFYRTVFFESIEKLFSWKLGLF